MAVVLLRNKLNKLNKLCKLYKLYKQTTPYKLD